MKTESTGAVGWIIFLSLLATVACCAGAATAIMFYVVERLIW